jgi:hypothetical protein
VVLFLAQVFGVDLTLGQQVTVVLLSVISGVGTAGVPGGSIPMIVLVLQSVGVPGESVAIILGIDRILDMCRTVLNVTGDLALATCVAGKEIDVSPHESPFAPTAKRSSAAAESFRRNLPQHKRFVFGPRKRLALRLVSPRRRWTSEDLASAPLLSASRKLLGQFEPKTQHACHRLHVGQLCIPAIFDVAYGGRVRNAGEFGDGVPGKALRFPRGAELRGDARRRFLATGILGGRKLLHDFPTDFRVPFSFFCSCRSYDPIEVLLCHDMILCCKTRSLSQRD